MINKKLHHVINDISGFTEDVNVILKSIVEGIENVSFLLACNKQSLLGQTNQFNRFSERMSKADVTINNELINTIKGCRWITSEEQVDSGAVFVTEGSLYNVSIDPLDGSSNLSHNGPVGTIFSISDVRTDSIVVAGYALYGSTTELVIARKNNVKRFVLSETQQNDPLEFVLIDDSVKCPTVGKCYSINESYSFDWNDEATAQYVNWAKGDGHTARNMGCMVADCHMVLLNGGLFVYPSTNRRKNGKLRIEFEAHPMAFIFEAAYGAAKNTHGARLLTIIEDEQNDGKTTVVLGSKFNVDKYLNVPTKVEKQAQTQRMFPGEF